MSVQELTVVSISLTGITPAGVTVEDDGMFFVNTGNIYLDILGGTSGALKVTIDSPAECDFGETHDVEITPVAATRYLVGPFPRSRFDDASNKINITFAAGAEADLMKIQAIKLP